MVQKERLDGTGPVEMTSFGTGQFGRSLGLGDKHGT